MALNCTCECEEQMLVGTHCLPKFTRDLAAGCQAKSAIFAGNGRSKAALVCRLSRRKAAELRSVTAGSLQPAGALDVLAVTTVGCTANRAGRSALDRKSFHIPSCQRL